MKLEITQTNHKISDDYTDTSVDGAVLEIVSEKDGSHMQDAVLIDWIKNHHEEVEIRLGDLKWKNIA